VSARICLLCVASAGLLPGASTGQFRLTSIGSLTTDPSEVVSGTRSIKGSYSGTDSYTSFLYTDSNALKLQRNRSYAVAFRYKILIPAERDIQIGLFSPTAYAQGKSWPSTSVRGAKGDTGTATLTGTLEFDDHNVTWWIGGKGAIAIDDIQITDLSTGDVVASEDAEAGSLLLPTTFFVSANQTSFVWGESVKVTAALRDETGQVRNMGPVTWTVNPPNAATVQADGTVTPRALQTFTVRASVAGKSGEVRLQARPKRIVVIPESQSMAVGATQKMRADVLDLNDRPIPNAPVQWTVSSQFYSGTASATIDQTGVLKGVNQARVRVVAAIRYDGSLPGFEVQTQGDALVDIKAPATYRFERIFVARASSAGSSTLAPRPAQLVPTETGGFMFAASLDGLGGALLEWSDGTVKPVLASGQVHVQSGLPLTDITGYARNASGELLTRELDATGNPLISRGPAGLITPLYTGGTALFGTDNSYGFTITRNSLADSGAMAALVGFTDSVTRKSGQGIFRGYRRSLSEAAISTMDDRLDPAEVPQGITFFGVANDGTVWAVGCCSGPQNVLWRIRPGSAPEKMLQRDRPLGELIVRGTSDNYAGAPTLFVASNGDVVSAVNTNTGNRWLLWRNGDNSPSEILSASATISTFWYDPAVGALLDTSFPGNTRGLYLWNKDGTKLLLGLNDTSLDGSPVEEIVSAACTSGGTVYAMVRTTNNPMVIARLTPNKEILLKAGDPVPASVPPVISALIPGARTGTPLVLAGGQTGSIARLDDSGAITPVVRLGDRLPDKKFYVGSKLSQVRSVPDGRIVFGQDLFSGDSGFYAWTDGTIAPAVSVPLVHAGGFRSNYVSALEVNRAGDIALWTGLAGNSLFRIRNGQVTQLGTSPFQVDGAELAIAFSGFAMDDSGRIAVTMNKNGVGQYLVRWDEAEPHIILSPDSKAPDDRIIAGVGNPRGCGDSFVLGALGTYLKYVNGGWQYLADRNEPLASGDPASTLSNSTMDVNYGCDVAFRGGNFGGQGSGHIGTRFHSKYNELQALDELTAEGDLLKVVQVLMNDDGSVYVLAGNDRGEEVIYRGTPLQ
jgi:hypothetical protein